MKAVFSIGEAFSYALEREAVERNCRLFFEAFPAGVRTEFFYYLKATEPERYFIIRSDTTDRENFILQATAFAENLDFEIIGKDAAGRILRKIDLDSFV